MALYAADQRFALLLAFRHLPSFYGAAFTLH
jgi:hypothetical protein